MKNNKGFTLVELLAVIIILGILTTIAVSSVIRYKNNVNEKEKVVLESSIKSAFSNYMLDNGKTYNNVSILDLSFSGDITYNNNKCSGDLGYIRMINNGDYVSTVANKYGDSDINYINYGVCKIKTEYDSDNNIIRSCEKNGNIVVPSDETTYCVYFTCNGVVVINNFDDENLLCSLVK